MNKKGVLVWGAAIVTFIVAIIPFFMFMFKPAPERLKIALVFVAIAAVLYVVGSRMITHKKYNYTVFQANSFYNECVNNGLVTLKMCKKESEKMLDIAKNYKYSQELEANALWEMYEIGSEFEKDKKRKEK